MDAIFEGILKAIIDVWAEHRKKKNKEANENKARKSIKTLITIFGVVIIIAIFLAVTILFGLIFPNLFIDI